MVFWKMELEVLMGRQSESGEGQNEQQVQEESSMHTSIVHRISGIRNRNGQEDVAVTEPTLQNMHLMTSIRLQPRCRER